MCFVIDRNVIEPPPNYLAYRIRLRAQKMARQALVFIGKNVFSSPVRASV